MCVVLRSRRVLGQPKSGESLKKEAPPVDKDEGDAEPSRQNDWLKLIAGVVFLVCVVILWYHYQHLLTVRYLAEHQRSIDEWVEGNFIWSRVCFVAAMSLCIGATVPGATFLSFAGGVLFPQPWSSICAYFGYVFGAALSFTLVKNFFGDFCRRHLRKRSIFLTFERAMKKNALVMLIVSRYTVIFPFWFVNATSALIGLKFRTFVSGTAIAVMPGAVVYTSAGRVLGTMLRESGASNDEMDTQELLSQTLRDPNMLMCVVGLALCGILSITLAKKYHFD